MGARLARVLLAAQAVLAAGALAAASAEGPRRVASINLCTDQLLLLLAPPERIVSIYWASLDPMLSIMAERARGVPVNHGLAEEVLGARPDLVLAGTYTTRASVRILRRFGIEVMTLAPARSLADIRDQTRAVARALGTPAQGELALERLEASLAALAGEEAGPRALLLLENGATAGRGTLEAELLRLAGLRDVAGALAPGPYAFLPLEAVLKADPEIVIRGRSEGGARSLASSLLHHPALERFLAGRKVIDLPSALWTCGTPLLGDAALRVRREAAP